MKPKSKRKSTHNEGVVVNGIRILPESPVLWDETISTRSYRKKCKQAKYTKAKSKRVTK